MSEWNRKQQELKNRIEINLEKMAGQPVIRGTRILVKLVVRMLAKGSNTEDIVKEYPHLTSDDIQAALLSAADFLEETEVYPLDVQ